MPDDEDPLSVACRLIIRSNFDSILFIRDMLEIKKISALGALAPISALEKLSLLTGCNFKTLYKNSLISRGASVWLGEQKISDTGFASNILKATRVCPICLSEDLNRTEDVVACRPYRRIAWRLRYLRACFRHGTLLLSNCPNCKRALAQSSVDVRHCSCGFDLANAMPIILSEDMLAPERYLFSRTFGKCSEAHWLLEKIAPAEAELAISQFGDVVAHGHKKRYFSQLSAIDQIQILQRGYSRLSSPAILDDFLDMQLRDATYRRAGPCPIYGSLYHWLYNADPVSFGPIKDLIAEHFVKTQKVSRSVCIFGRKILPQNTISAEVAAQECGCSVVILRSLLEMIEGRPIGLIKDSDDLNIEHLAKLKILLKSMISSVDARKALLLGENVELRLEKSAFFRIPSQRKFARRFIDRKKFDKLVQLFSQEQRVYTECPEGFTDIYRAAVRFRVSVADIAWRVIEGEVTSVGVIARRRGLASVLVGIECVKNMGAKTKNPPRPKATE